MKRVYWRPRKVPRQLIAILALASVVGIVAVELFPVNQVQPAVDIKRKAAARAIRAMEIIREERLARGHAVDPSFDPTGSGMIGDVMTPTTSVTGHLSAKQTSVNPNFAAVVVDMLQEAGVERGDRVAIGCSGSFPAFNVAVYAAVEEMGLEPVVICSATASQFGANFPDLLWIDMERLLQERGVIHFRAAAASMGGFEDRGARLSDEGRDLVIQAIERNGLEFIDEPSFGELIEKRMDIYRKHAAGKPFRAYINVGGGTVSVGRSLGKKLYNPGVNLQAPEGASEADGMLTRFVDDGVPVIHLVQAKQLAEKYGLAIAPTEMPLIGEGKVYVRPVYNRWLAAVVLFILFVSLRGIIFSDLGPRLLGRGEGPARPREEDCELMV